MGFDPRWCTGEEAAFSILGVLVDLGREALFGCHFIVLLYVYIIVVPYYYLRTVPMQCRQLIPGCAALCQNLDMKRKLFCMNVDHRDDFFPSAI